MWDSTSEQANRTALLLVNDRYTKQLAPFVKGKKARLAYVQDDLHRIISNVCDEVGADAEFVTKEFNEHIALLDAVLKNPGDVKREQLTNPDRDEPYAKNLPPNSNEGRDDIVDADVMDRGEVPGASRAEALEPDARVDLSEETSDGVTEVEGRQSCVRCGNEKTSSASPVCKECNAELLKLAYPTDTVENLGEGAGAPAPTVQEPQAVNPNMPYACTICGREGSADEIRAHIGRDHADVLQRQDEMSTQNMGQDNNGLPQQFTHAKEAAPLWLLKQRGDYTTWPDEQRERARNDVPGFADHFGQVEEVINAIRAGDNNAALYAANVLANNGQPKNPWAGMNAQDIVDAIANNIGSQSIAKLKTADVPQHEDAAEIQPLPQNPGDRFDDYVQRLAESAAARKFSQPSDEDIHSISSQVGASPDEVKNGLVTVAVFGDNVAVNGQLGGDPTPPEGYEEISAQGLSGQMPTHDALVPTDLIINTVATDMNMSNDLAYQQVKDKYGDDLPTTYHASISGQVHYYLPSGMAGNQPPTNDETGPAAPPAPQAQPQQQQQPMPTGRPNAPSM